MSARIIGTLAFGVIAFVTGCSGTTTGGGSSSGSSGSTSTSGGPTTPGGSGGGARQACLDTADAVATAITKCGGTYQANYDSFITNVVKGSCSNVTSIRDESSLRGACFRFLSSATCAQLESGFDASCKEQLVVSTNTFEPELAPASGGNAEGWAGAGAE